MHRTNTHRHAVLFKYSFFFRFRQKCWHRVHFWLLRGLNWSHKQTAGVGVYDNINEKLLWGPAGWWSRVKLPGPLHSIIVYLISASLLFGSTRGSSSHGRRCDSHTEWNKKVQTSRTVCCEWTEECCGRSFYICTLPATAFILKLWNISIFARLIILENVYTACWEANFLMNAFYVNGLWKIK